jgi:NADH-quinone oxidoreductase subunit G
MNMIELTIDGEKVEVPAGSMLMQAVQKVDKYVPHFCYHPKLSIAANCRMCLVDVEKAPKPLPACATPVSQGMVVHTSSAKAKVAQQGVMEFLLINHPLDCPICDQGGECQLQDLAVGYGTSSSRYTEEKRMVFHKNMGSLISAEEMSRCILCTRCVRFGQEVAGVMELGVLGRGEHSEITSFVGRAVESELSGNMIDVCPVGALTSKPFRYSARTWELTRRKTISAHDAVGSHLQVQSKLNQVKRVVPNEFEAINQCWISDKDRFAYEGLNIDDRLKRPMLRKAGEWVEVSWEEALVVVVDALKDIQASQKTLLVNPTATQEELFLLKKLVQHLGFEKVESRLREPSPIKTKGVPWLGTTIESIEQLDFVLVVGGFLRRDFPLLTARLRQAVKRGAKVASIYPAKDDWHMPLAHQIAVKPSQLSAVLSAIAFHVAQQKSLPMPVWAKDHPVWSADILSLTKALLTEGKKALWLGHLVTQHQKAQQIHAIASWLSEQTGMVLGVLPDAANSVGAHWLGFTSNEPVMAVSDNAKKELLGTDFLFLWNVESRDFSQGSCFVDEVNNAKFVLATALYKSQVDNLKVDVVLPIVPFTETPGTFVNLEGVSQSFEAVVPPLAQAKEGWKVLRVLGTLLNVYGTSYDSIDEIRDDLNKYLKTLPIRLDNRSDIEPTDEENSPKDSIERLAEVGIYSTDAIVRRAVSLQKTPQAKLDKVLMNTSTLTQQGLQEGSQVKVLSERDRDGVILSCAVDDKLMDGVVRIALAHFATEKVTGGSGLIELVKVS